MTHMKHERAAPDRRSVGPGGRDAEIMGDLVRGFDGRGDAVDVRQFKPRIGDGVERCICMQLDLRHVRNHAEFGCFCSAYDGDLVSPHGAYPFAGRNRGSVIWSSSFSKATSRFMSSSSASGV